MLKGEGKALVCESCGRAKPLAKIAGKYYCYECGRRIVEEHIREQLKELERKGIIRFDVKPKG
ncbi:MAG: hypothetical protein QXG48_02735 [Thermofilaceae archaeon]